MVCLRQLGLRPIHLTVGPSGQYAWIQAAITAATSGDRIEVSPGTYAERIDFLGKDVAVVAVGATAENSHTIHPLNSGTAVLFVSGEGPGALLEGFTISGVSDPGGGALFGAPGGIEIRGAEPTIRGCWIIGNRGQSSHGGAGGIGVTVGAGEFPTVEACVFRNNRGGDGNSIFGTLPGGAGGLGIWSDWVVSAPSGITIRDCLFERNTGGVGGSVMVGSPYLWRRSEGGAGAITVSGDLSLTVTGTVFRDNVGSGNGPGAVDCIPLSGLIPAGGGWTPSGSVAVTDCRFEGNNGAVRSASLDLRRSVVHASGTTPGSGATIVASTMVVSDCVLIGNLGRLIDGVAVSGPGLTMNRCVVFGNGSLTRPLFEDGVVVADSIVWGNTAGYGSWSPTHCCIENGAAGPGNIALDPQFVRNPSPGPDGVWSTPDDDLGDLRLQPTSPCIDTGDPTSRPAGQDIAGMPRLLDGDLDGAMRVDMGAREFGHVELALSIPAPNQLDLILAGTAGLPATLLVGLPSATGFSIAPLGELFLDVAMPLLAAPVGSLPQSLSLVYPNGSYDLAFQAVVLGGAGGNLSNAETLSVR